MPRPSASHVSVAQTVHVLAGEPLRMRLHLLSTFSETTEKIIASISPSAHENERRSANSVKTVGRVCPPSLRLLSCMSKYIPHTPRPGHPSIAFSPEPLSAS